MAVNIVISDINEVRGSGLWRFNARLLDQTSFVNAMNSVIDEALSEFAKCDPITLWEMVKIRITEQCIKYSQQQAYEKRVCIKQLQQKVLEINAAIQNLCCA